ncbi:SDR family NAD(P)-dependent oxidoreductase [Geodermatophilus marinus]|uniref:SDR family NAD(P)-dependent oxidoreductase n=1 Tax=Geodermatophilus sp. LHW52908 TaxID=2303986 RepID=UPI000E3D4D2A|nr:SDR family NAD(P)-dependent oxidoreductase [Geodermatophilus sp. LHW52908]RFU20547.1 SDR family NAD(P)-dependent oxidoreductase [Geodermatophilus sp. LHW52908]
MSRRFTGRRALVTGASRGIGAAVAERLAAEGADVVLTARTLEPHGSLSGSLRETAERLSRHGTRVELLAADLSDPDDVAGIVPAAVERLGGPIDVLVNNAAAAIYQPLADYPLRRRLLTFQVNVHAPLELMQAVIPGMRQAGGGWIVNVSSASARLSAGPPFSVHPPGSAMGVYAASKAALNRITNLMAVELYGSGIRVNTVEPQSAVLTEGAVALVGELILPAEIEALEEMTEAATALCECPEDVTGRVAVSLDLIREWNLTVRGLDAQPWKREEIQR